MEYVEKIMADEAERRVIRASIIEDGITMTGASLTTVPTRFGKAWLPTLLIGGVGTKPEYRRGGYVRSIFERALASSAQESWVVSLLHPFSFNYYRMFGYEQVSDHRLVTLPMEKLSHIPRFSGFRPYCDEDLPALLALYNERFAENRNLIHKRLDASRFAVTPDQNDFLYVLRENGKITAYIRYHTEKKYIVNHMGEGILTVKELGFDSPAALLKALGFLRMYEGELETIFFANLAPIPEVEFLLREYIAEKIEVVPDIAARVLDTAALLKAVKYPEKPGCFTVQVEDSLPKVAGTFRVAYAAGTGEVERLDDTADFDVKADAPAFTRLVYGYDGADAQTAAYMYGVQFNNPAEDFFRAFPKHPCGLFEHF